MSKLVIVESPAKAKTIGKYLGSDYVVKASMGHLRDLPKKKMSIDIEHDFQPEYVPIEGKDKIIKEIRSEIRKSDFVYLATDPDREGEAISWHIKELFKLKDKNSRRVTFNEITKQAVRSGIENPRDIDIDLVNAQQARRILDRIVGYQLSPFLWRKVKRGLSAGRVQSVATRLVVDRENEIRAFVPEEYWSIEALLQTADGGKFFSALLRRCERQGRAEKRRAGDACCQRCYRQTVHRRQYQARQEKAHRRASVHHLDAAAGSQPQAEYDAAPHDEHRAGAVRRY